ncbi:unnamed protein product, partial [Staurois parvus]
KCRLSAFLSSRAVTLTEESRVAPAVPPVSVHQCLMSVPRDSAQQCHINATYQCPPVHINATYQCPSELPFSVTHQCQSVPPINANQCC